MRSMLALAMICFLLFAARPSQAEELPAASATLTLPPSGRGMALAGGILTGAGLGLIGFGVAGALGYPACPSPCGEGGNTNHFFQMVTSLIMGVPLTVIGLPLMVVGIDRTMDYKTALRRGLAASLAPLRREAAQKEVARNLRRDRIGMIVSGVFFGLFAAASIGTGAASATAQRPRDASELQTTAAITGILGGSVLFPFLWCAGNYASYKSMLAGTSAVPPISDISLAPVVSSNQYGISLTGRWR